MNTHPFQKHILITGHYGSGKTNLALSLAVMLAGAGKRTAVVDIDIVNPYFRAFDAAGLLEEKGIDLIAPLFANTNLDLPSLPADIGRAFTPQYDHVIFDVGGDPEGAVALGTYSSLIAEQGYDMLYVINIYRPLTSGGDDTAALLSQIESTSRLTATGLINNSNLSRETTPETVEASLPYAEEISALTGLPVVYTAALESICRELDIPNKLPVAIYTHQFF